MYKRLILLFVLTMLICFYNEGKIDKRSAKERAVDNVSSKFINKVTKEHELYVCGYGGSMLTTVKNISIDFIAHKNLTIEEARHLYVKLIEEFKDMINTYKEIEEFMDVFPCTHKNIGLAIRFENDDGNRVAPPYIAYISIYDSNKGNICYRTYNKDTNKFHEEDYEEHYEDALRIVKGQSLLGALPQSPSKN